MAYGDLAELRRNSQQAVKHTDRLQLSKIYSEHIAAATDAAFSTIAGGLACRSWGIVHLLTVKHVKD